VTFEVLATVKINIMNVSVMIIRNVITCTLRQV
jgi:predicted amino acid-binding ACT domain protein